MKRSIVVVATLAVLLSAAESRAKDWYVAEGSSGDGSKENPFDDPQRAIGDAVAGDAIHVVQGTYYGKLRVGYLVIAKRGLTLVGGYKDKSFAERDPFKYPTFVRHHPGAKSSTFEGGEIRVHMGNRIEDHQGTTIDGFWFDRKDQNDYNSLDLPPAKCPGCLKGGNSKPIIWFEHPDCHVRNSVFLNTWLYAVRLYGDGSSAENNLFVNVNYCGIDIVGKGQKLGKGYPFAKFLVKNNTFVSAWNCCSLERGAGSFVIQNGGADVTLQNNLFHLSNGNTSSMGYVVKDERNFKADKWIHFLDNSISQMRGGLASVFMTELNASANIDYLRDLKDTPWESAGNDEENPFFKLDRDWLDKYSKAVPKKHPNQIEVKMDDFNKMRSMLGLPLDAGSQDLGGQFLAWWYPLDDVKRGTFFKPTNAKLAGRGLAAAGPFPVVKAKLVAEGGEGAGPADAAAPVPDRDYKKLEAEALWSGGDAMIDQAVEFVAYHAGTDTSFDFGVGKQAKPYLEGTDKNTHEIMKLRRVGEMDKAEAPIKGYVAKGSAAYDYYKKDAKRSCTSLKEACNFSFVVKGVIKKPADKVNMGRGPQVVVAIDALGDN